MNEIQVTMTELRQSLGRLVNRAAYGGERIVLVAHGTPKAAIISVEDLQHLKQLSDALIGQSGPYTSALANARLVRDRIQKWQEAHNIEPEDSVDTLQVLREERDDGLIGLR